MSPSTTAPAQRTAARHLVVLGRYPATRLDVALAGDRAQLHVQTPDGVLKVLISTAEWVRVARSEHDCNGQPIPKVVGARANDEVLRADAEATRATRLQAKLATLTHAGAEAMAELLGGPPAVPGGERTEAGEQRPERRSDRSQNSEVRSQSAEAGGQMPEESTLAALSELATLPKISPGQKGRRDPARWVLIEQAWQLYLCCPALKVAQIATQLGVSCDQVYAWWATLRKRPGAPVLRTNGRLVPS